MSTHDETQDMFSLRMLEISLLPSGDPRRVEFEAELKARGDLALREWEQLLSENENLRGALLDVPVPPELTGELLRLPTAADRFWLGRFVSSPLVRMAATVLLVLAFGGGMFYLRNYTRASDRIEQVAELALDSYVHDQDISVITLDPDYMQRYLEGTVPFEIKLPASMQSNLSLIGGKSGSLGAYPAVYTRWSHQVQQQQTKCAIIQFRSKDFGLPETAPKAVIHSSKVNCPSAEGKNCNVVVWSEGGNGYALVADSACAMHCIGSR